MSPVFKPTSSHPRHQAFSIETCVIRIRRKARIWIERNWCLTLTWRLKFIVSSFVSLLLGGAKWTKRKEWKQSQLCEPFFVRCICWCCIYPPSTRAPFHISFPLLFLHPHLPRTIFLFSRLEAKEKEERGWTAREAKRKTGELDLSSSPRPIFGSCYHPPPIWGHSAFPSLSSFDFRNAWLGGLLLSRIFSADTSITTTIGVDGRFFGLADRVVWASFFFCLCTVATLLLYCYYYHEMYMCIFRIQGKENEEFLVCFISIDGVCIVCM